LVTHINSYISFWVLEYIKQKENHTLAL